MADDISLVVGVDYSELTGLVKTTGQTKRALGSMAKEFANSGSQKNYMAGINKLVAAQKNLDKSARLSRSEIMKLGNQMKQEVKFTNALTSATKKLNVAQVSSNKVMQQTKNRMNGNNMAIQQLGYQFGDFAVQVQGGTSAFVAFSQQGAQLAGMLPMIAGPLGLTMGAAVGLSAALGILIPIGSSVARMFFEMSGSAEKAQDALGDTVTAINAYRRSVEFSKRTTKELNEEFGEASKQLMKMQGLLQSVAVSRALDGLTTGTSMFGESLDTAVTNIKNIQTAMDNVKVPTAADIAESGENIALIADETIQGFKEDMETAADALGLLPKQAIELQTALADINKSKDMEGLRDSSLAALELIKGMGFEFGKIPIPIAEVIENLENVAGSAARATGAVGGLTDAEKESARAAEDYKKLVDETTRSQAQRLELSRRIHYSGKDSLRTAELIARQEAENLGLAKDAAATYVATELSIRAIVAETEKQVAAQKEQDDYFGKIEEALEDGKSLSELNLKSPFEAALPAAKLLAETMNIALTDALSLVNAASFKDDGPINRGRGKSRGAGSTASGRFFLGIGGIREQPYKTKKNKSGGGAKEVDINEIIEARKQQAAQERVLIGLSGQQHEAQKIYYDLLKKNEDADIKLTETQIRGSANVIAAYEEQNRVLQAAEQQRQQLVSSIESSLEEGFMSMIDGTKSVKDAFRDMARDIIRELYRVLVVKKLVASVSSFFGFADGGAFSGGSQIQAYADGGVVGGPTFFPMAGNKTGLMGEAGPEAIMPLKRGANGKLGVQAEGGGGDVINISQSFNFQANGDDSVKKLIAQAAPQIANMTQKQIMDSRRRGGSMKAAFG